MTVENEKSECAESISFGLHRTAAWRRRMASQYPNDPRNSRAAERLTTLADDALALSDHDWGKLQPHYDWHSTFWREAIGNTARQVEFTGNAKKLSIFVDMLASNLNSPTIQ